MTFKLQLEYLASVASASTQGVPVAEDHRTLHCTEIFDVVRIILTMYHQADDDRTVDLYCNFLGGNISIGKVCTIDRRLLFIDMRE